MSQRAKEEQSKSPRFFPAYLAIYWTIGRGKKEPDDVSTTDVGIFYDRYLKVPGSPQGEKYPWVNPFEDRGGFEYNLWRKDHLPGSLGNSLKPGKPMAQVVDVSGEGTETRYHLRENHSELALKHLLHGERVPVHYAALFFLRDFCIEMEEPSVEQWIRQFQDELGFLEDGKPNSAFSNLFLVPDDENLDLPDEIFSCLSRG